MDYDELNRKYGQRYCFAPYQGDDYFDAEIRMHLKNLQKHAKLTHQYNILDRSSYSYADEFRASIDFFERLYMSPTRLLSRLMRALQIPHQEERYIEVRIVVWGFFCRFNEQKHFDWR